MNFEGIQKSISFFYSLLFLYSISDRAYNRLLKCKSNSHSQLDASKIISNSNYSLAAQNTKIPLFNKIMTKTKKFSLPNISETLSTQQVKKSVNY